MHLTVTQEASSNSVLITQNSPATRSLLFVFNVPPENRRRRSADKEHVCIQEEVSIIPEQVKKTCSSGEGKERRLGDEN